jgi:hypothetical protein
VSVLGVLNLGGDEVGGVAVDHRVAGHESVVRAVDGR